MNQEPLIVALLEERANLNHVLGRRVDLAGGLPEALQVYRFRILLNDVLLEDLNPERLGVWVSR